MHGLYMMLYKEAQSLMGISSHGRVGADAHSTRFPNTSEFGAIMLKSHEIWE